MLFVEFYLWEHGKYGYEGSVCMCGATISINKLRAGHDVVVLGELDFTLMG